MPSQAPSTGDAIRDIHALGIPIPPDVERRLKQTVHNQSHSKKNTPLSMTQEMFAVYPEGKIPVIWAVVLACVGELLNFGAFLFAAYAATWVYSQTTSSPQEFSELVRYAVYTLAALILSMVCTCFSTNLSHRASFSFIDRIHITLFERLQKIPQGYLVENSMASIKTVISDQVSRLEDWIAHLLPELPSRLLHPILSLIILFIIDVRVGLSLFVPVPLMIVGFFLIFRNVRPRMLLWMTSYEDLSEKSVEYVRGIPIIKAFLQDQKSFGQFASSANFYHTSTMEWWKQSWLGTALATAAGMTPLLGVLPVSLMLFNAGDLTVGELVLSLILPLSILPQMFPLMQSGELIAMISEEWSKIQPLLNYPVQNRPPAHQRVQIDHQSGVVFDHVSFSYSEGTEVLHDISFTADKNQVTALVGLSGSGKSTIARLLAGFWDVDSGTISLGGIDCQNISFEQLMEEISYVSQDNFLFDCSIKDNIKLGNPHATDEEIIAAAQAAHCHDFIVKLKDGYNTRAGDTGGLLSGGERQRITLARALLKPSNIIILDEATAYADPENEALIQDAISRLIQNKSLLVVAHRLHTITDADKILVVDKGRIQAQGTHDELLATSDLYKKLWKQYCGEVA